MMIDCLCGCVSVFQTNPPALPLWYFECYNVLIRSEEAFSNPSSSSVSLFGFHMNGIGLPTRRPSLFLVSYRDISDSVSYSTPEEDPFDAVSNPVGESR